MIKIKHIVLPFLFIGLYSYSQQVVTLKPGASNGKDATIFSSQATGHSDLNDGDHPELPALAWTISGNINTIRSLIEFDLSFIQDTYQIISAELSLFYSPLGNHTSTHSQLSGPNGCYIRRIIEPWDEDVVTWNNQPETTADNQVSIEPSSSPTQDYPNIDVTQIIKDIIANPTEGHGLMLMMQTESHYRSMIFASSDHPDEQLYPELKITYHDVAGISGDDMEDLKIYPNPIENTFEVVYPKANVDYTITDINGKTIQEGTLNATHSVLELNASAGIYLLKIEGIIVKLVKE